MKGNFYGLRGNQIAFGLLVLVCTMVLIWAWDKTPTFLLPPLSRSLQLLPGFSYAKFILFFFLLATFIASTNPNQIFVVSDKEVVDRVEWPNSYVETIKAPGEISSGIGKDEIDVKSASLAGGGEGEIVDKKKQGEKQFDASAKKEASRSSPAEKGSLGSIGTKVDSKQVSVGKNSSKVSETNLAAPQNSGTGGSSAREHGKNLVTNVSSGGCNYAKGKWVEDDARPLYSGFGCKQWLSGMWACRLTQRTDFTYEKLRWQPKDCPMDEFTGPKFLERMRNKTLAFVGDSLGRQQFQSLMCMVTGGEERPDVINLGKEYGLVKARRAVRPDGWVYHFPTTNTTILFYWSASLSDLEPLNITNPLTDFAMHLDRPPAFLKRFIHRFDVLVLNTGHHWNRGKFQGNRWVMHVGGKPNADRKIANVNGAKNFTVHSIVNWANSQILRYPGLKVFFRSISPRHFFNGDWNTGGTCDNIALSGKKEVLQDESSDPAAASAVKGTQVKLLDITGISELRDEGHISRYSIKATPGMQDCLHWCLPGVPDTWNEILFAQL